MKKNAQLLLGATGLCGLLCIATISMCFSKPSEDHSLLRPSDMPSYIRFNPETHTYYDSTQMQWDSKSKRYISIHQSPMQKTASSIPSISSDVFNNPETSPPKEQRIAAKDPVEEAIAHYQQEASLYFEKHPELAASSKWEVGLNEDGSGPLNVLIDLGLENLPHLFKHIKAEDSLCVPVMIAACEMTHSTTGVIDISDAGIQGWKNEFNSKIAKAQATINLIVSSSAEGNPVNFETVEEAWAFCGIFALPALYDELKSNPCSPVLNYMNSERLSDSLKTLMKDAYDENCTFKENLLKSEDWLTFVKNIYVQ